MNLSIAIVGLPNAGPTYLTSRLNELFVHGSRSDFEGLRMHVVSKDGGES